MLPIRVLKNQEKVQNHQKGKTRLCHYLGQVVKILEQIREICRQICSKRLPPNLPEAIKVLERSKEINITKETKQLLLKNSSATADRCLRPVRLQTPHVIA